MNLLRIAFLDGIERIIMIWYSSTRLDRIDRINKMFSFRHYLFIVTLEVASVSRSSLPFLVALPTKMQLVNVVSE